MSKCAASRLHILSHSADDHHGETMMGDGPDDRDDHDDYFNFKMFFITG